VVADAALGRAPAEVVLDAVTLQYLDVAVVTMQRDAHGQRTPGGGKQGVGAIVESQLLHRFGQLDER
jgi:hypothetical protein